MKVKPKFDLSVIQTGLVDHVEKICFGGVVLVLVLFGYRAVTRGGYDKTPEDLDKVASDAETRIAKGGAVVDVDSRQKNYVAQGGQLTVDGYEIDRMDESIWEKKGLRGMPVHLAVEDLRGAAGHGATSSAGGYASEGYASAGEAMAEMTGTTADKGVRFVVLTGLVPYAQQVEEYEKTFKDAAFRTQNDMPRYFRIKVERTEILNPSDPVPGNWEPVSIVESWRKVGGPGSSMMTSYESGVTGTTDDIHPAHRVPLTRYKNYSVPITFPLPNLVNHRWGPEICHPPEIPLARDLELEEPTQLERPTIPEELPDQLEPVPGQPMGPAGGPGPMASGPGLMASGAGGYGGYEGYPGMEEDEGAEMMSAGGYGEYAGYGGSGGMAGPVGGRVKEEDLKYRLFRFFDFSVEPGKHYMYRVTLLLLNPNSGVDAQHLKSPDLAKAWYVTTPVSQPSPVITVPQDADLLAGPVKPSRTREPTGKVGILRFLLETGQEKFAEFDVRRGQLLNYPEYELASARRTTTYGDMGYPMGEEGEEDYGYGLMASGGGMEATLGSGGPPTTTGATRQEPEKVDFITETLLLDLRGGEKIRGRTDYVVPGKILLLDQAGRLVVRDQLDDEEVYVKYKPPERKPGRGVSPYGEEGLGDMEFLEGGGEYGEMMEGYEGYGGRRGRGSRSRRSRRGMMGEGGYEGGEGYDF